MKKDLNGGEEGLIGIGYMGREGGSSSLERNRKLLIIIVNCCLLCFIFWITIKELIMVLFNEDII